MSAGRDFIIVGVDGGQTATKSVLGRGDGTMLAAGTGPACDHLLAPGGLERNRIAIHTALRDACARAGISLDRVDAIGLGLTSAQRELDPEPTIAAIVREVASPATIWVDNDVASNLAGASGGRPGIVVIAGGGSVGYGVDEAGREAISGGLGYLMGDDGSAWFIGIEALRAAARGADLRGPETALLPMVLEAWGLESIREVLRVVYREDFRRSEVASLAPLVTRIAGEGDGVAREIVTRAAELLAWHALGVAAQLHGAAPAAVDVYPTGGVFAAGASIHDPFVRTIHQHRPDARIHQPRFSPAIGAFIRAAQQHGLTIGSGVLAHLDATASAIMPRPAARP